MADVLRVTVSGIFRELQRLVDDSIGHTSYDQNCAPTAFRHAATGMARTVRLVLTMLVCFSETKSRVARKCDAGKPAFLMTGADRRSGAAGTTPSRTALMSVLAVGGLW